MERVFKSCVNAVVQIEIKDLGNWGGNCSLEQITDQAKAAAIGHIRKFFPTGAVRIVGEPDITIVTIMEKKD